MAQESSSNVDVATPTFNMRDFDLRDMFFGQKDFESIVSQKGFDIEHHIGERTMIDYIVLYLVNFHDPYKPCIDYAVNFIKRLRQMGGSSIHAEYYLERLTNDLVYFDKAHNTPSARGAIRRVLAAVRTKRPSEKHVKKVKVHEKK